MTRATFRSWAEDYVHRPDDGPIDLTAFRARAAQRGQTARMLAGKIVKATSPGRNLRQRYEKVMAEGMQAEHTAQIRRLTDPVEIARLFLQRRGDVVFAAEVVDGPQGKWKIVGRPGFVSSDQLLRIARAKGFGG